MVLFNHFQTVLP